MSNARGGPGYVVDMDRTEEKSWCRSQERFLEKVGVEHSEPQARDAYPRPVINWLVQEGLLTGQARMSKKAKAHVAEREKAAAAPPKVLPGLSTSAPKPTEAETPKARTPRPKPEEASDAVEGKEATS